VNSAQKFLTVLFLCVFATTLMWLPWQNGSNSGYVTLFEAQTARIVSSVVLVEMALTAYFRRAR
jgi:hypothetical protein